MDYCALNNVSNADCMQKMASSNCTTTAKFVTDSRDGEEYIVQRLADGKCWMLDNLRLDITDSSVLSNLTTSNTHVDSASLISLRNGNRSAGDRYATSALSNLTDGNLYSIPLANADYKNNTATSYGLGSGKIGVYYNFCAASAGNYCFGDGADPGRNASGNAEYDLCPYGWRMPTGGSSGEYQALYVAYSSDYTSFMNAFSTPLSGTFGQGSVGYQGQGGFFWASTYQNIRWGMTILLVNTSIVHADNDEGRDFGDSMRCVFGS